MRKAFEKLLEQYRQKIEATRYEFYGAQVDLQDIVEDIEDILIEHKGTTMSQALKDLKSGTIFRFCNEPDTNYEKVGYITYRKGISQINNVCIPIATREGEDIFVPNMPYLKEGDNLTVFNIDDEGTITVVDDDGHKYHLIPA